MPNKLDKKAIEEWHNKIENDGMEFALTIAINKGGYAELLCNNMLSHQEVVDILEGILGAMKQSLTMMDRRNISKELPN